MRQTQFEFFSPLRFNDRFEFAIWMLQWRRLSVYLRKLEDTGGEWVIVVERPDDGAAIATCTLRWALVDRASGEARQLPVSMAMALEGRAAPPEVEDKPGAGSSVQCIAKYRDS